MTSNELNRRVTIKSYSKTKDDGGGTITAESGSYTVWANVQDRSGSQYNGHNSVDYQYDYKVTFRYDPDRIVTSANKISYDSKLLTIRSLSYDNETDKRFCIARCSVNTK